MTSLRHAFRTLVKSPGFTVIAVLMLALGIGLSASSFSMANTFLLRNVPYSEPERLVRYFSTSPQFDRGAFSPGNILELRQAVSTVEGVALYTGDWFALGEPGQPAERVQGMTVTPNFFDLIGVRPSLGRAFTADEESADQARVAIITQRAWVRRYGSDPSILGRTVRLNSEPYTIVGVLPASFDAPLVWGPVEYFVPQAIFPDFSTNFKDRWISALARLKPGVSLRDAQSEASVIATRLVREHPKENVGLGFRVVSLHDSNMDNVSRVLLWLMTIISLAMLIIACANLASLQVARAFGRSREFAIRAALGGSRRHLMTPLLLESMILAIGGGIGGLFVTKWSNDIIGSFLLINNEPGFEIAFDGRVVAFAAFAAILSGLAFGLAPAWLAGRSTAAESLKEGSRGSTAGRSHNRLKNALIVGELALALALVGVASSFGIGAKSFLNRHVGWNIDGLFTGYLALPYNEYNDPGKNRPFQRALLDKLSAIPGVENAVICGDIPRFYLGGETLTVHIEGLPVAERGQETLTMTGPVSPDYFSALRINLKAGRVFTHTDDENAPLVAVVNETFARRYWPGESAIGKRVRLGDDEQWLEIVGVVSDVKMISRFETPETPLQLYRPYLQAPRRYFAVVLRSPLAPESLTRSVREAVASLDPDLPVADAGNARAQVDRNLSNINLVIINLGVSAGMGLLIAGIGLFGVISQLTVQRTRDIGVRMALGAQRSDILSMVIGGGTRLLIVGIALGIPCFYALHRLLGTAMPEIDFPGIWLLVLNLVVLSASMLIACYLPARRATAIDPTIALRSE